MERIFAPVVIKDERPDPSTPIELEEENQFVTGEIWGRMRLYRVFSISSNMNSFGLHGVMMMRRNGEAWEVGISQLNLEGIKRGSIIKIPQMHLEGAQPSFAGFAEIPRKLPQPPQEVIEEVWKGATVGDIIGWPNDRNRL